jgi:preprotein translocase subunit SecY
VGSVNLTGVTPPLFIVTLLFLLAILSTFSMAFVRGFQKRTRPMAGYIATGLALVVVFVIVLIVFF